MSEPNLQVVLNAVLLAVTDEVPRVLTFDRSERGRSDDPALPFGALDPVADRTLELAVRKWVRQQAGVELEYVEQLYTFGDRDRLERRSVERSDKEGRATSRRSGVDRVISIAYLALVEEAEVEVQSRAEWSDCYRFLPWEDSRSGRSSKYEALLEALLVWTQADRALRSARRERVEIAFGLGPGGWDTKRVLERYELLYEAGLVAEGSTGRSTEHDPYRSPAMAVDHRRILATALGRLRGKLEYRPLVFELMPEDFTLLELQRAVEALAGVRLHKQNFRRLVERGGLVEGTGRKRTNTGGRPAELFRFRREVVRERAAPGVGLPGYRVG